MNDISYQIEDKKFEIDWIHYENLDSDKLEELRDLIEWYWFYDSYISVETIQNVFKK